MSWPRNWKNLDGGERQKFYYVDPPLSSLYVAAGLGEHGAWVPGHDAGGGTALPRSHLAATVSIYRSRLAFKPGLLNNSTH